MDQLGKRQKYYIMLILQNTGMQSILSTIITLYFQRCILISQTGGEAVKKTRLLHTKAMSGRLQFLLFGCLYKKQVSKKNTFCIL